MRRGRRVGRQERLEGELGDGDVDGGGEVRRSLPGRGMIVRLAEVARRRLRTHVEGWNGRPLEAVASLQAMYAGHPEGLATHLAPYIDAGLEHVVLRVADEPEHGLDAAAGALRQLSSTAALP